MLDITLLRKDLPAVVARLETRQKPQDFLDVAAFTALYWAAAFGDLSALAFALLALLVAARRDAARWLALPLFAVSLLCKESTLLLPVGRGLAMLWILVTSVELLFGRSGEAMAAAESPVEERSAPGRQRHLAPTRRRPAHNRNQPLRHRVRSRPCDDTTGAHRHSWA